MRDTEIVASIVAGDPNGLAMAYDRYADPLFRYCRSLLADPADAADAVQDTFVIAASRLDALREPERFRAWLYTVARNESLRILRSKKGTSALDEAPDVTDVGADVGEHAERAELRDLFENATAGLNPGEREVIELQLRQGLEAGEVAAVLGVSRNHAHTLLSRARSQLEACLAVLLVARAAAGADRDECGELGTMLDGWDGRLTVLLRKRVHRHIEQCATCTATRAFELRPAMLLDLSPGAALAAGAAESLRLAFGAPSGLRAPTIALATGHGPEAAAHGGAVLSRAGAFGRHGFPKPAHAGAAWHHGAAGSVKALRSSPRGQAAAAGAVVVAVAVAATAFALTGRDEHFTPSASPKPPGAAPHAPSSAAAVTQPTATGRPSAAPPAAKPPATRPPAGSQSPAPTHPAAVTPATPAPARSTRARPAPTSASPTPAASTPSRTPTPTPTKSSPPPPPPPPPPPGALSVLPDSGTVIVVPGVTGSVVTLLASGGAVTWSVVVANDPNHVVSVSPADSGTLTPAHPVTTLTIRTSQFVQCGLGTATSCPAVTISPGGATFAVWTGWTLPLPAKATTAATLPGGTVPASSVPATAPATPTRRITIRS